MAAAGAALFAGVGLTSAPASAMPAGAAPQVLASGTAPLLTDVQWRNDRWRYGNRYGHRGWGGPRYGYRRGWGGGWDNGGAAAAAGIAGLATGAILGGVLSQPRTVVEEPVYGGYPAYGGGGDAVGYCAQRFRSYDPASGTYLGYDGLRHPCP
jgi:hypothetical protein